MDGIDLALSTEWNSALTSFLLDSCTNELMSSFFAFIKDNIGFVFSIDWIS